MTIHRLKFDAYRVGDRLLDGVHFAVLLDVEGLSARVVGLVPWDESSASYLKNFTIGIFREGVAKQLQPDIDYLARFYGEQGKTLEDAMADWTEESGEPGVQIFVEV